MNEELKQIKKIYGEEMMHICRELFPTILEKEGKLLSILQANLAPSHLFAEDIKNNDLYEDFSAWVYTLAKEKKRELPDTGKDPFTLMDEAEYKLYECKSKNDIMRFKRYYAPNEELCTFWSNRLERCHVFFAVKKNVSKIKREKFLNPRRQDEYGTSVISLQFSRGNYNTLSIKNRYNHTVNNPDATFSNDLEKIIPGLTKSFEHAYGFNIRHEVSQGNFLIEDLSYVQAKDGKYYRYYCEDDAVYYCENNVILKNYIPYMEYAFQKERYLLFDKYILDLKEKKIFLANKERPDSFIKSIYDVGIIKKIEIIKSDNNRIIEIAYEDDKKINIVINDKNSIIYYDNKYVNKIVDDFLKNCRSILGINLSSLETIGDNFLLNCYRIEKISLPNVKVIGNGFIRHNRILKELNLPKVVRIGSDFLFFNDELEMLDLPCVQKIGNEFLYKNNSIREIHLPKVITIGRCFLIENNRVSNLYLPVVKDIGEGFMGGNLKIRDIFFPKAKKIGKDFLFQNVSLRSLVLPSLTEESYYNLAEYYRNIVQWDSSQINKERKELR